MCGKWKLNDNHRTWFIDIQYQAGSYILSLNPSYKEYKIEQENLTSYIIIETRSEDCRNELGAKGWYYYVHDRDAYADQGFPTHGEIHYNRWESEDYYRVTLEGQAPLITLFKVRNKYFMDDILTYADTTINQFFSLKII